MIDIKSSGATQLTMQGGELSEWLVKLDGEELYTLPDSFTVQDTFTVRRILEKYMDYAYNEGMKDAVAKKDLEIEQILETGNTQLNALIDENERLSTALEKHIIKNQPDY